MNSYSFEVFMFLQGLQSVLAVYWPVPAGLSVLLGVAVFNHLRLRQPVQVRVARPVEEKLVRHARA